jgi:hypothetical protein
MPAGRPLTPITLTDDERVKLTTWARRPTTAQRIALRAKIITISSGRRRYPDSVSGRRESGGQRLDVELAAREDVGLIRQRRTAYSIPFIGD